MSHSGPGSVEGSVPLPAGVLAAPARVVQVELAAPLAAIPAGPAEDGRPYRAALVIVSLHGHPLGKLEIGLGEQGLAAAELAPLIWGELHGEIVAHLRADGLPCVTSLTAAGLPSTPAPCQAARDRAAAGAVPASIVVASRERPDRLAQCLPAMLAQQYASYEVIVVDNAPTTSRTADLIARMAAADPRLHYAREDRPGLSWARDCGLNRATGQIVAFLDDDEIPTPYWLAELAKEYEDEKVACVTGLTIPVELETEAQVLIERFGGFAKGRAFARRAFDMGPHRPPDPLFPYLSSHFGAGGNTSFRTSVLRQMGGFDVALGAGTPAGAAEEIDTFFRVIMAGYTLVSEPAALVRHYHRREVTDLRRVLRGYGTGFTAYLTRNVIAEPRHLLYLLGRLPQALAYLFGPNSARNSGKREGYPAALTLAELWGMACGPVAYWRSSRRARRLRLQYQA